ncbi:MAG: hypothetical protein AB7S71_03900 [Dongiaceae bacterium]
MSPSTQAAFEDGDNSTEARTHLHVFSIFVLVYTTAFLLEMVEHWTYPAATTIFLVLSIPVLTKPDRFRFLLFLGASTFYLLWFRFPEVANHVNLIIFTNVTLIVGISYSYTKYAQIESDDDFYELIMPILGLMITCTFLVAGFHKFNYDFISPQVSCIRIFAGTIWQTMMSDFLDLGIRTVAIIGLILAVAAGTLWLERKRLALPAIDWTAIATPIVATLVAGGALLLLVGTSSIASSMDAVVFVIAIVVLCWQIVEGLLLLIPRYQWVALVLSLAVHVQLAMIRLVDFQAIALALLMTFIPPDVWRSWMRQAQIRIGRVSLHRARAYFLINMFGGLLMLLHNHVADVIPRQYVVSGILFNLGVLIMLWPILKDLLSKERTWRWEGVPVLRSLTFRPLYLLPVALLLFGLTSHFGLRTTGNFSMFSNLRTEGPTSNHILLPGNPLKFAGYQEDVVRVIEIDDEAARIGHQYQNLKGNGLPMVEFRKLLLKWREAGRIVPITFEHRGETIRSEDIATEPRWRVDGLDWEMRLLDFRIIQPNPPNQCRW